MKGFNTFRRRQRKFLVLWGVYNTCSAHKEVMYLTAHTNDKYLKYLYCKSMRDNNNTTPINGTR